MNTTLKMALAAPAALATGAAGFAYGHGTTRRDGLSTSDAALLVGMPSVVGLPALAVSVARRAPGLTMLGALSVAAPFGVAAGVQSRAGERLAPGSGDNALSGAAA